MASKQDYQDMLIEDENGTTVLRHTTEYVPRRTWRTWLIGRPLPTADAPHQTIGKLVGLAVFASDALSSTAYAPQEMMLILAAAGAAGLGYALPLTGAICVLLVILTLSYEQTIHAYPSGGGAYIVARDNLGEIAAQTAAAALLTDYILTVAVSISSGVAQITSAITALEPYRVEIAVGLVIFVMLINLRGVKESGVTFAIPTYFFLLMVYLTIAVGLVRLVLGSLGHVVGAPAMAETGALQVVGVFLLLRAFSSGTTALTGVEAISNGIPAFREPRSHNAGITLVWMAGILGTTLVGITLLANHIGAVPSDVGETVISQLARTVLGGRNIIYLATMASTTLILIMAANTSYADFPRLSALAAADGFLPRQLTYRGSRLVYSRGIGALALIASALIIIFQASVNSLIPLYAIGVFLSFTLSQAGMALRWQKSGRLRPGESIKERGSTVTYDASWRTKMIINGIGAVMSAIVMVVFAATKFFLGAWVVVVLIPSLAWIFSRIHSHYQDLARSLSLEGYSAAAISPRHKVIIPVAGMHRGTLAALRYAMLLSDDVTAVHVSMDDAEAERLRKKWEIWGEGIRLLILESPYRLMVEPLLLYIEKMAAQRQPNETITIVVPEFVPQHWWQNALHTQTASILRLLLLFRRGIIVTDVPYRVEHLKSKQDAAANGPKGSGA